MYHKFTGEYYGESIVHYYDPVEALWVWEFDAVLYLSALLGNPISVAGSSDIYPTGYLYNGKDYYYDATSELYIWFDGSDWVMSKALGFYTHNGTTWWKYASLVGTYAGQLQRGTYTWVADVVTVSFTNHGKLAGDSIGVAFISGDGTPDGTYTVATASANSYTFALTGSGTAGIIDCTGGSKAVTAGQIEGWEAGNKFDEYTPVSGSSVTGDKWVGWKILQDGGANEFIQDLDLFGAENTYTGARSIWFDSGSSSYIINSTIGTKDGAVGYWSCATLLGTYTRTHTGGGTAPTPVSYIISLKEYREKRDGATLDTESAYLGQVAVWL